VHPLAIPCLPLSKTKTSESLSNRDVGYPEPSSASPIPATIETPRHTFNVIHTPGHSPDHICLHEPHEGWLFVAIRTSEAGTRALRRTMMYGRLITSLKRLSELDVDLILTGSGNVRRNALLRSKKKIAYLESTAEQALELHRRGFCYRQIRRKLSVANCSSPM